MALSDKDFYSLIKKAEKEQSRTEYIAKNRSAELTENDLGGIFDLAHISVKDIRASTGLSQVAFGNRFCVPRRTIEDWERGERECPLYTRLLLAEVCGMLKVRRQ